MGVPGDRLLRWWRLTGDLLQQPLVELPYDVITPELVQTFAAYGACLHRRDLRGADSLQAWPTHLTEERLRELQLAADRHPIARWYRASRSLAPCTLGRLPRSVVNAECMAAWAELSRPYGLIQQLFIPLHVGTMDHRTVVVARPDADFCEDDVELARLLQPVLLGLERQAAELRRWRTQGGANTARNPHDETETSAVVHAVGLTGRELTVLCLLAEGLTASAIGRRLGIAQQTVHKHLQRLYAKLRTGDRLTTVLRAQQMGLLSLPHGAPPGRWCRESGGP